MSQKKNNGETNQDGTTRYFEILLRQYSECWSDIRNYSNSIWQIPAILITVISILGVLYSHYLKENQIGRILVLLFAFGFSLVALIALIKHRFFSDRRVEDFEDIQRQLELLTQKEIKELLKQEEFKECKVKFREIKWRSEDLAKDSCCIYRRKAYLWQRTLVMALPIGITVLLLIELIDLVRFCP